MCIIKFIMIEIKEVECQRILNPTSIDLGEYVINPYRGCEFSCLYCYVRHNKVTLRETRCWGKYVDIRSKAPALLEKELGLKKPHRVLLGSTTDCFQPLETTWQITRQILAILNRQRVYYSILTRSPLVLSALPLLKEGFCEAIYFTINQYDEPMKNLLEPKSPSFASRKEAIKILLEEKVPVIPYFSPLLPCISDFSEVFHNFEQAQQVGFEGLNFHLGNIHEIIEAIAAVYPKIKILYQTMLSDQKTYDQTFGRIKKEIIKLAIAARKNHRIFIHGWRGFFTNTYH